MALMERKRKKDKDQARDPGAEKHSPVVEGSGTAEAMRPAPHEPGEDTPVANAVPTSKVTPSLELVPLQETLATTVTRHEARPRTLVQIAAEAVTGTEERDHEQVLELERLPEMHRDILGVARESLKKKRFEADIEFDPYSPMVEKLLGDCVARFRAQKGYTRDDILGAIKDLEARRWIITGERRTRDEIMESELHQSILALIQKYPGIHARDERVQQELGITRNPFLKHLLVLERFGLVSKRQHGKAWNYYVPSFPADDILAELVVLLYNDVARQLVSLLLQYPGSTIVDLARRIIPPVFHGAIQYHLKKFEDIGFVTVTEGERVVNSKLLNAYNDVAPEELRFS